MDYEQRAHTRLEGVVRKVIGGASRTRGPIGTFRRKMQIQEVKFLASRYSLQEQVAAFLSRADREALTGLDLEQLDQLVDELERMGTRVDTACDAPGAPPAR